MYLLMLCVLLVNAITSYNPLLHNSIENDEIKTGKGAYQIGTLQRPGDTRWSSHFNSICGLLHMYNATALVLEDLVVEGSI